MITVYGKPQGKGRPRYTTRAGHAVAYTPAATKAYEAQIRQAWKEQDGRNFGAAALAESPPVAGFATDGYSESYGDGAARSVEAERQLRRCVALLLYGVTDDDGTPLLYAGVGCV